MIVTTKAISEWEFDEEELFLNHADRWESFMGGELYLADDIDKEDFLRELFWDYVSDLGELGGIERYDDYEIEFTLT